MTNGDSEYSFAAIDTMLHLHRLRRKFSDVFGTNAEHAQIFFSPGRVCLIGEHIDYNGGFVLPAAVSLGIYGVFRENGSNTLRMYSGIGRNEARIELEEEITFSDKAGWGNYPAGVVKCLMRQGVPITGGELLFESNLPVGAGLSSSAAMEVLTGYIFSSRNSPTLDKIELATLCKKAENDFVGVQCGIMDQFAVAMGKKNHAVKLNCNSLRYEYVPVEMGEYVLVIFNTNKKRELTGSLFNQRVSECNEALGQIMKHKAVEALADAGMDDVNCFVTNPVARKRALHVVQENIRVKEAAEALKSGDIEKFGMLLFRSHESLRKLYEVTGHELDALEEAARKHPACIGAKMSGAGFGGCALAIVKKDAMDDFVRHVLESYHAKTGLDADFYLAEVDEGVRRLG